MSEPLLPPDVPRGCTPRRIVILTAEVGEGHVAAARALAADLLSTDETVDLVVLDVFESFGRVLPLILRDAYRTQLRVAPWAFGVCFFFFLNVRPLRGLGRLVLAFFAARPLARTLVAHRPDLVVSTYPAATSVLGSLRRRGGLAVPTCATITDLGAVSFWSHPAVDLHLVMHPAVILAVEREAGPGSARAVRPLVAPAFREPRTRVDARNALDLPANDRVVVVSGGGWAVGDLAGAASEALALPDTTVVCLAGRDEAGRRRLERTFAGKDRIRVLGFTDRMPELLAAADVLVHSTGGVTCLEALATGCPIVAYGAPRGHAPALARAMASLGLATHARSRTELRMALLNAARAAPVPAAASSADEVLRSSLRPPSPPAPARARRMLVTAAAVAAFAAAFSAASSERAFALLAHDLDLRPLSTFPTNRPRVALVIETSRAAAPALARLVAAREGSATFAFRWLPSRAVVSRLVPLRDNFALLLPPAGVDDWMGTADSVGDARTAFPRAQRLFVIAPASGMSPGQYLLARYAGAEVIYGGAPIVDGTVLPASFARGAIVVVALGDGAGGRRELQRLLTRLSSVGLRAMALGELAGIAA